MAYIPVEIGNGTPSGSGGRYIPVEGVGFNAPQSTPAVSPTLQPSTPSSGGGLWDTVKGIGSWAKDTALGIGEKIPFIQTIAKIQGRASNGTPLPQAIGSAVAEDYRPKASAFGVGDLNSDQLSRAVARQKELVGQGMERTAATKQAISEIRQEGMTNMVMGSVGEGPKDVLKGLAGKIAKSTNPTEIAGMLKTAGVVEKEIPTISSALTNVRDPQIIENVLMKNGAGVSTAVEKTAPSVAGNINLDKFNLPAESKAELAKIIEDNQGFIEQRRGTLSTSDIEALSKEVKLPTNLKPGKSLNAEELQALGNQITYTREQLDTVARNIAQGMNDDTHLIQQAKLQTQMGALLASYAGATAEAGRSLQILKNLREAVGSNDVQLIKKAVQAVGGRESIEKIAQGLAAFPENDLLGKYRYIRSLQKPGAADWASWYWYNNLLSGPKTHIRNIIGNTSNLFTNTITKPFAAGADLLRSKIGGTQREVFMGEMTPQLKGLIAGLKEGWRKAAFLFENGFTMDNVANLDFRPPEVAGGKVTNFIGRALDAADTFFRSISSTSELWARAYAEGAKKGLKGKELQSFMEEFITNPPVEAMRDVAKAGAKNVFRDAPGKITQALASMKNDFTVKLPSGKTAKIFNPLKFIIPFVSTPANIMKTSMEYTPMGFAKGFFESTAREQSQTWGRAAFGSLALAPLALMAAEGNISGSGPKDTQIRDMLYRQGWQPNAIKIGGKWYSYSNFQPLALPLSIMANAFEEWHYEGKQANIGAVLGKVGNSFLQQSYLSGLSSLQAAMENPESYGKSFINQFLTSAVPLSAAQGQLARSLDTTVRKPDTVVESIEANTPGLSQNVRPRLNNLGEPSTRDTGLPQPIDFLSNFLSPIDIRKIKDSPVEDALMSLVDSVQIGAPGKSITYKNAKVQLTPDEYNQLAEESGKLIREKLASVVETSAWQNSTDEKRAKFVENLVSKARTQVKDKMLKQNERIRSELRKQLKG